ncbi:porin [Salinicola halophilus]|uniref:porin n=1 Tax=Salinicola halophilus TaxID=184065 RepID=UPI000DA17E8D|nr:porin [Salinicola halophilus]
MTQKTFVAGMLATGALLASQTAAAVTLYETVEDKLTFSGRIAAGSTFVDDVSDDHDPTNAGSRVRLIHEHNFQGGWTSIARAEWGFDPFFEDGDDAHYKRMLYAGASHDEYGTVLIGKQYSLWYDMVAYWTDWMWYNGASAQGSFNGRQSDGGFEGNGRPDNAITYKNNVGDWTLGAMYQTSRDAPDESGYYDDGLHRDKTFQGAAVYQPTDEWAFGLTYTHSSIDGERDGDTDEIDVDAGLVAARWTPGNWYFALTAGEYKNLVRDFNRGADDDRANTNGIVDRARGYEAVALYNVVDQTPGTVQLYTGYNSLRDRDSDAESAYYVAGAAWLLFEDNLILALEQKFDDSNDTLGNDDAYHDETDLLVRYNF